MGIVDYQRLMKYGCSMVLIKKNLKLLFCNYLKTITSNFRPKTYHF